MLGPVTDPLFLILLGVVAGLLLRRRARAFGNGLLVLAGCAFHALSTPLVSAYLLHALESRPPSASVVNSMEPQAIVVLGGDLIHAAPEYFGDTVGRLTLERIRFAARLHRKTALPILVTGGPIGDSDKPLSVAMKEALNLDFQVPVRWVEAESRNTFENARLSAEILVKDGIQNIYLVTHAWHMPRAAEAFGHFDLRTVPAPTAFTYIGPGFEISDIVPRASALANSAFAVHEWVGRLWYRLAYY